MSEAPNVSRRIDYTPSSHSIEKTILDFQLDPRATIVEATYHVVRDGESASSLFLDGENLELLYLAIDSIELQTHEYAIEANGLRVFTQAVRFTLTIKTRVNPEQNTSLEGLYYTNSMYCTQCEAQGFRKIVYSLDRPDVLSCYTVSVTSFDEGDSYLLSNGNLVSDTGYLDGKRTCVWHDPHPKPSYLFAMVAGHFDKLDDTYTTASGREVKLELFVDEGRKHQGQHALDSLKKAMQWDEQKYSLEYDLDIFMIVAVDFFNMGAMENKGLNIFNSKYVLADPKTATDQDYFNIESIVAHEYFHNWTGNRVTCRDWFQLSLKEGLTVFRDQQFSADVFCALSTRIQQVESMREHQFAEDAGPMSHPIRPDEVIEMNNFYTLTVYEKGAEVIRMLHTLLSEQGFLQGIKLYFERHDGQAVTCDDFVNAMQDANNRDLSHFKRWYSQSGTPRITVTCTRGDNNAAALEFRQNTPATRDQEDKQELYIPIKLECFNQQGEKLSLPISNDTFVLESEFARLDCNSNETVIPALLQDFSAPVIVDFKHSLDDLLLILKSSQSDYSRWEAVQGIFKQAVLAVYQQMLPESAENQVNEECLTKAKSILQPLTDLLQTLPITNEVKVQLFKVPSTESFYSELSDILVLTLHQARELVQKVFAEQLLDYANDNYLSLYGELSKENYAYRKQQVHKRSLKNTYLHLLAVGKHPQSGAYTGQQYASADNMTDRLAALNAACEHDSTQFSELMNDFEAMFSSDTVVMDKWFALHAKKDSPDILSQLDLLQAHTLYNINNPNKVRSLVGSFAFYNTTGFHQQSGAGYAYLADYLCKVDKSNPQVAARLVVPLIQNAHFHPSIRGKMQNQLKRIFAKQELSKDLYEKISKSLVE